MKAAAKAVESSKLDKTVADADGLYKATEGNVQDEKTREALKQAIAKRDAGAIAKAVKSVNDSKAAKEKADAEAKAKAEQEAAEQEAAAQAAAEAAAAQSQTQQSYSAPRQSYTPRIRAVRHRVAAVPAACRTSFQAAEGTALAVPMIAMLLAALPFSTEHLLLLHLLKGPFGSLFHIRSLPGKCPTRHAQPRGRIAGG